MYKVAPAVPCQRQDGRIALESSPRSRSIWPRLLVMRFPPFSHAHFPQSHEPMQCDRVAYDYGLLVHAPSIASPCPQYVQAIDRSRRGIDANPVRGRMRCA
jgi:hypothetical protein